MLTRLKVSGFKNLIDVDVRLGPFTCIAGANGVGKSNLFDAICFLSALADRPLIEAALSVRDEGRRTGDVRSLFHRVGDEYDSQMSFEAEMIVPAEGIDDLGQVAKATITFLRYSIKLAYREDNSLRSLGSLELIHEELVRINRTDADEHILFDRDIPHKNRVWRQSVLSGRRSPPFISTEGEGKNRVIKLHQDGGNQGRALARSAVDLPRTVLSVTNAAESPTALLARREMQSWQLLQLEPSSLRQPDEFTAPTKLGTDGSHLASTLYYLARSRTLNDRAEESQVYAEVADRLSELLGDVDEVNIDRDDRRELLTLIVKSRNGTTHPARSLSDGTMRFLALAVLELDPNARGLLCLEEPENGIHPERIPKILRLLQDIATDIEEPIGLDNPLRQVIINTHSPAVVKQVPDDSLLVAELKEMVKDDRRFKRVCFSYLENTWRDKYRSEEDLSPIISKGILLAYLNPDYIDRMELDAIDKAPILSSEKLTPRKKLRVIDRKDLHPLIPRFANNWHE
jgi:predicted ATPase